MCGHVVQRAAVKLLHADCNNLMVRAAGSITGSRWWPPTSGERFTSFQIFFGILKYFFSQKANRYFYFYVLPRARSMLGKGQIYLPRDGFKRAHSWAEGVVSERVLEAESQQKKVEQLVLNLLFHPQLKQYIRSGIQEDYCIRKISLTPSWVSAHLYLSHHHDKCSAGGGEIFSMDNQSHKSYCWIFCTLNLNQWVEADSG